MCFRSRTLRESLIMRVKRSSEVKRTSAVKTPKAEADLGIERKLNWMLHCSLRGGDRGMRQLVE